MKTNKFSNMTYVDFISFIRETNRCPGGKNTINWILQNSFANKNTKVLEIGSNTGFSSLEVARVLNCSVFGIDVSKSAVETANNELKSDIKKIKKLVKFRIASAYDIPCRSKSIDLIISGGSTSFMDDKSKAMSEMYRVLRDWGFCSVTNLFYHTKPPKQLLKKVSDIIGVEIKYMTEKDWMSVYTSVKDFEVYKFETEKLSEQTEETIENYINYFMGKPHIKSLSETDKEDLKSRWLEILSVFNENHKYLSFIKCLLRKRPIEEEPELFKIKGRIYG